MARHSQDRRSFFDMNGIQIAAAILTGLHPDGGPSGHVYMALQTVGVGLDRYQAVLRVLQNEGHVTNEAHYLRLTETGKALAIQVEQALTREHKGRQR
jgi:hypothetical protein